MMSTQIIDRITDRLDAIPRRNFVPGPTPLMRTHGLNKTIGGPELWMKRDDLIPIGFGGNKIRGLDYLIADALEKGADTIVSGAGTLSNHVRAVAMASVVSGLKSVAVYWGKAPDREEGNYRLVRMMGADIRFTEDYDRSSVDPMLDKVAEELKNDGHAPYVIPRGGACTLGVIGHVMAVRELLAQCQAMQVRPDTIILAAGSGCTLAGWLLGTRIFAAPWRVEAITVSRPADDARANVKRLGQEAAALLDCDTMFEDKDIIIHEGYIGDGYGVPSEAGNAAITQCAANEAVLLDPVYTGKAMAGYAERVRQKRYTNDKTIIFLHSGGEPSLFVTQEAGR